MKAHSVIHRLMRNIFRNPFMKKKFFSVKRAQHLGSVPVETYSRNWIWPRSIFIIGSVWRWNWYCTHINLNNVILWGIIPICKIFAKTWHFLFCFGVRYSFWPFALTRECALHLRPCEKTPEPNSQAVLPVSRKRYGQSLNKFYILRNRK